MYSFVDPMTMNNLDTNITAYDKNLSSCYVMYHMLH